MKESLPELLIQGVPLSYGHVSLISFSGLSSKEDKMSSNTPVTGTVNVPTPFLQRTLSRGRKILHFTFFTERTKGDTFRGQKLLRSLYQIRFAKHFHFLSLKVQKIILKLNDI